MPDRPQINFLVDGVEVPAEEGTMLVDAAKHGDIEIPVFCYEPKLGDPVGACRMCLVEIEGIPKLQTACSTPVRDGMVVYTRTDRVQAAQEAVVEFLLVNHPLDCPVCDKGGECPLQDIAMGWGPGRSRVIDPKRHFQKPIPLSPLIKIDRERCILCYRCVRFSQEVAEDEQLQLLERGASTFVGTFDDRPYIAPFHGNIIELCPVGALTSEAYRFRARPWEIEDAGSICTLCPSQCNVILTVRDERIERVLGRDHPEVDDGWLCDKGRFGYQMAESEQRITQPLVRQGGELHPASWEQALEAAAAGLREAAERAAAIVGGQSSNEEGYLAQRILRRALGSPHVDSRPGSPIDRSLAIQLALPELAASVADLDSAEAILVVGCDPLHEMPILDLRIRKAVRRHGARLAVATDRPSALDGGADETARYAPGFVGGFLSALAGAVGAEGYEQAPDELGADAERIAGVLKPGSTVIVWAGEADGALVECARKLDAKLLEVPEGANGRGLREVGCVPHAGPGLSEVPAGRDAAEIRDGLADGSLEAAFLLNADPVRDSEGRTGVERGARRGEVRPRRFDVRERIDQARRRRLPGRVLRGEGGHGHPPGRPPSAAAARSPASGRRTADVAGARRALRPARRGDGDRLDARGAGCHRVRGSLLRRHHPRGDRRPRRPLAGPRSGVGVPARRRRRLGTKSRRRREPAAPRARPGTSSPSRRRSRTWRGFRRSVLGTYRDLWAYEVTERSPALRFLAPRQTLELAPADADRLGVAPGDEVDVRSNGTNVRARVVIRERVRPGAGFLIEGLGDGAERARRRAGRDRRRRRTRA